MITINLIDLRSHAGPIKSNHAEIPTAMPELRLRLIQERDPRYLCCPSMYPLGFTLSLPTRPDEDKRQKQVTKRNYAPSSLLRAYSLRRSP